MNRLIFTATLLLSSQALATYSKPCGDDFSSIVNKQLATKSLVRSTEVLQTSDLLLLSALEADSFEYYLAKFDLSSDIKYEEDTYKIETHRYINKATGKVLGFRIDVDDLSSDEANLRFYYKLNEDNRSTRLLQTYWDNQSPERVWICEDYEDTDTDQYILELATDIGEYFRYNGTKWEGNIDSMLASQLPLVFRNIALNESQNRTEIDDPERRQIWVTVDDYAYAITKAGQIIGYVLALQYDTDHSLFDGGGIHLYYNASGKLLHEEEWWG